MQGLIEFLKEDRNTHLEHLEDEIISKTLIDKEL